VLVIDGKNNNDNVVRSQTINGMFIGMKNNNDGMIIGRLCQVGTRSLLGRCIRESSRSSEEIVQSCMQSATVRQGQG
jgi:hypothetical protein